MIIFENVTKSYNGKRGCMCGCNGDYSIPSHVDLADANKAVGWEAYDEHNDRKVKIAIKKINDAIDWNDPKDVAKHVTEHHAYTETDTRTSVVYF